MKQANPNMDLQSWLSWLEQLHPSTIELGLERVQTVQRRMALDFKSTQIVIVGGTNGKGSTVAMLTNIMLCAGYTVGTYTSPHLHKYNERVCYNGMQVSDDNLCEAFKAVEAVRAEISLTYFEYGTLAALYYFALQQPNFMILEVGLGGRLDAVNILDPAVSILTNVELDHMEWLGTTREQIGIEKSGIFRPHQYAIYGALEPPDSVLQHAKKIGAKLLRQGKEFGWQQGSDQWTWQGTSNDDILLQMTQLPLMTFPLDNASAVVQALYCLIGEFKPEHILHGLATTTLPGRFQEVTYKGHRLILDVAHNPHAASNLANNIRTRFSGCKVQLVIGMLVDKDSASVLQILAPIVTQIHAATLTGERGASAKIIYNHALKLGVSEVICHASVAAALVSACSAAEPNDVIVVTGSFYTVAAVMEML